ncbi:tRNA (adenosine(37)-N6)-threonylcarbamoyltransferase complex dimerization subunit type 1 TsaB [Caulobacter sp. KR2-114]|uniref:tRNA (adenosine(37)-N6)-threonylcarbamoyltransferase complex dimerization subunit type 1 TsaB n=1 Tax=Caulobacter sp. KR2-114 TaxID=3400912 RepID=UPI003C0929FC
MVLALDTCLGACSVAVTADGRVLASACEPMTRGHQERLAVMAREVMAQAGIGFAALDRIGVTVGPGSFTGLRVGVAFAKGLGLALGVPCVGVGSLEALAATAGLPGRVAAAIDSGRGQIYLQTFADGRPLSEPAVMPLDAAMAAVAALGGGVLVGPGVDLLQAGAAFERAPLAAPDPAAVARLASLGEAREATPLYLRPADATPPKPRPPRPPQPRPRSRPGPAAA